MKKEVFEIFENWSVNSVFIGGILLLFSISVIIFLFLQTRWMIHLRKGIANGEKLKAGLTKNLWQAYQKTFLENKAKTRRHASDFFNFASLRGAMGFFDYLPGSFIGLGVLGTFIGLTKGLAGFTDFSVEGIQSSIEILLGGITTAFYTSIVGMGASLIFGFIYRIGIDRTMRRITRLTNELDHEYYITDTEATELEAEKIRGILDEYFTSTDEANNKLLPKHMLKRIAEESSRTSEQLSHFSSDLADGLLLSSETVNAISERMGEGFNTLLSTEVTPVFEELRKAVDRLGDLHENDSENLVGSLKDSLTDLMQGFKETIVEESKSEMAEMRKSLEITSQALSTLPDVLENSKSNYAEILEDFRSFSSSTFDNLSQKIDEVVENSTKNQQSLIHTTEEVSRKLNESTERKVSELETLVSELQKGYDSSSSQLKETMDKFEELVASSAIQQEIINSSVTSMTASNQAVKDVVSKFEGIATNLNKMRDSLESSSSSLERTQREFHNEYKTSLDALKVSVERSKDTLETYSEGFKAMDQKLQTVFTQMSNGLEEYRVQTKAGLETYMQDFSNQFAEGSSSLSSTYEILREIVEELESILSKSKR